MNTPQTHPRNQEDVARGEQVFEANYAVYVLKCKPIDSQFIDEVAKSKLGGCPEWATEASHYERIYYVGSTSNLYARLGAHLNGRGADFSRLFEPTRVMQVRLTPTEERAKRVEGDLPETYRLWERRFVYSDLGWKGHAPGNPELYR